MTTARVATVDVILLRQGPSGLEALVLQRAQGARCTGAWEVVHGRIEPGERPEDAAIREVREETGLVVERLYNVTVQPFYLHMLELVSLAVVFAAFTRPGQITLGPEHSHAEWLTVDAALSRLTWPRTRASLGDAASLLAAGDAGPVEDVLRVV
jgi:8-oxo-dGTP pyrophosphatase MutT (NUDIX family)